MIHITGPFIIQIFTHQVFPVVHPFPSLAPYPHGDNEALVFYVPYDNIYDISEYFQPHFRFFQVIQQFGINICDPHHHFAAIQGTHCLNFCTLWVGIYAHISFPFQIIFADQSMLAARSIQIILLFHQLMSYKEPLLFFLADTTLQCMIREFTTFSSNSSRSSSTSSFK